MQILGPTPDLVNQKLWMGLGNLCVCNKPPGDSDTHSYNLIVLKFLWEYLNDIVTFLTLLHLVKYS